MAVSEGQTLGHVISSYVELLIEGNPKYYERFGVTRADAVGVEPPPEAHGPQYFMIRPLASYDPAFHGRAIYPPETFGIAY